MSIPTVTVFDEKSWLENAPADAPCFSPSPTVEEFLQSVVCGPPEPMRLLLLQGPRGEGKTTAAIWALLQLAQRLVAEGKGRLLPVRVACVRDTWANLERTTLVSFEENAQKGMPLQFLNGRKEAKLGNWVHVYFFGLDNRQDCDKLQGFQCGVLWLEEVAPAAELAVGIPSESLAIGITSVRQAGVPKRVIVTFNPPDEDHWIMTVEKTLMDSGQRDILVHKCVIPPGEKSAHFKFMAGLAAKNGDLARANEWDSAAKEFDAYRRRNELALEAIGRFDLVDRLVRGKVGGVALGEALVPFFNRDIHVTTEPILPIPGAQMVRGWDGGLTPSTVFCQIRPAGGIDVLGSITSVSTGMADHIRREVYTWQEKKRILPRRDLRQDGKGGFGEGYRMGWDFRDVGDPALLQGNQVTRAELTAGLVIENLLGTSFEPGPVEWSARREALLLAFSRNLGGMHGKSRPFIRLDGTTFYDEMSKVKLWDENKLLIQGLNGRAHYPVDPNTGRINDSILAAKRVSHIYLQALDALAYILAVLAPAGEFLRREPPRRDVKDRLPKPTSWLGI